jgi:hypothetical protein
MNFPEAQPPPPVDYKELGYTDDEDRWPEFYRYACEVTGLPFEERAILNHAVIPKQKPANEAAL